MTRPRVDLRVSPGRWLVRIAAHPWFAEWLGTLFLPLHSDVNLDHQRKRKSEREQQFFTYFDRRWSTYPNFSSLAMFGSVMTSEAFSSLLRCNVVHLTYSILNHYFILATSLISRRFRWASSQLAVVNEGVEWTKVVVESLENASASFQPIARRKGV